jgi:hypothetical protein
MLVEHIKERIVFSITGVKKIETSLLSLTDTSYKSQLNLSRHKYKPWKCNYHNKKIGETLEDFGIGKEFLDKTPKAHKTNHFPNVFF